MSTESWEETKRRYVEYCAQQEQEAAELRKTLQNLLDRHGWEDVIEFLAAIARDQYETSYREHDRKLTDALDTIVSGLW